MFRRRQFYKRKKTSRRTAAAPGGLCQERRCRFSTGYGLAHASGQSRWTETIVFGRLVWKAANKQNVKNRLVSRLCYYKKLPSPKLIIEKTNALRDFLTRQRSAFDRVTDRLTIIVITSHTSKLDYGNYGVALSTHSVFSCRKLSGCTSPTGLTARPRRASIVIWQRRRIVIVRVP